MRARKTPGWPGSRSPEFSKSKPGARLEKVMNV